MTAASRTATICSATLLLNVASAAGQIAARATYLDDGSFDLPSAGPTSPREPAAIAVAPDGRLHIVDQSGQVTVFNPDGSPVRAYGGGGLRKPVAVAIDELGRAYVLDQGSKRVTVFNSRGEAQLVIGGSDRGVTELNDPVALAIGPRGFVYVLDGGDPSVAIFSRDGAFVRQVGLGEAIEDPVGLAVGGDGRILIADKDGAAQVVVSPAFTDVAWQGPAALETLSLGAVEEAVAVAVDGSGTTVVLDGEQGRIWGGNRLDPTVATQTRPLYGGVGRGRGSFREPVALAFTPEGHVVVLDAELRKVERIELTEAGGPPLEWNYPIRVSQLPPDPAGAVAAIGPAADGTARFVVASPLGTSLRVERVTSERYQDLFSDVFESYLIPEAGGPEAWVMGFQRAPGAMAFNDTLLAVTEPDQDRFSVFDVRDGNLMGTFGRDYDDDRKLDRPVGVALFSDGSFVIADRGNHRVGVFSADLTSLLASFPMREAWGVAISPDGELFAWSEEGLSVVRIPLDGSPSEPVGAARLTGPVQDIEFDAQGNVFVLEKRTSRITVLDSNFERVLIKVGGRDTRLEATHLSVDALGNIYVANLEQGRTMVYRWDARLPELETLRVALSNDDAAFSWEAVDSEYLWGYRLAGSASRQGPFTTLATTTGESFDLTLDEGFEYAWLRVDPVSIAGSVSPSEQPIPVAHRVAREAAERESYVEVLDAVARTESLSDRGVLSLATVVAQEVQWHAFSTEFALGRYEEAVTREAALEGWEGEDQGFELYRRLAIAHGNLGQYGPALANARQALQVMPARDRSVEAGVEVLQLITTAAFETGAFDELVTFSEELQGRVGPDREFQFFARLVAGHVALGNPQRALQIAGAVLEADRAGDIVAYDDDRPDLYWAAFQASLSIADTELMELWGVEFGPYVTGDRRRPYYEALSRFRASQGDGLQARANFLQALDPAPEPEYYADPATVGLTFDIFRALQDGDRRAHTAGLDFLAAYAAALPREAEDVRLAYEDSIAVWTPREDTRGKLGEGFRYWDDANFVMLIQFFEQAIEEGGLTPEQETISRGLLAGAYQSAGRSEDAESTYRGILDLDPLFDIDATTALVQETYGIRLFDRQALEVFRNVRRIR